MTIPELNIKLTPLIEDAFFAFRDIDDTELNERLSQLPADYVSGDDLADRLMEKYEQDLKNSEKALERLNLASKEERAAAINTAFQMIENLKKYGIPCAEWCP